MIEVSLMLMMRLLPICGMVRDNSKCILCRRCVAVCDKYQDAAVIGVNKRGFNTHIGCEFDKPLNTVACVECGQCIVACPTGALYEKDQTEEVWAALRDPEKRVVVQTAPSVRAGLGECFGMHIVGALGVAVALFKSEKLRKKVWLQVCSVLLCITICLATMFLKQHSAVDVMTPSASSPSMPSLRPACAPIAM